MGRGLVLGLAASAAAVSVLFAGAPKVQGQSELTTGMDYELKALEAQVEAAYLASDTAFLNKALADDFVFTHATGTVAGKIQTINSFARPGNFRSRTLTSVGVELHGDVAPTNGRTQVNSVASGDYTVCYVRLYTRGAGGWQLTSHRTFREATGFAETCAPR